MVRPPAKRMVEIQPFHVMELLARAKELEASGRQIIHMEVGEPDFPTPQRVVAAGKQALDSGHTKYTPALGLTEARQAVSGFYLRRYGVTVPWQRIAITPGASGALQLALGVTINPGEQVLLADPGYPCNRNYVRLFEGGTRSVPVDERSAFQLNLDLIRQHWTDDVAAVLIATPSNPTGTLVAPDELVRIHRFCTERNVILLVDEIYRDLVYDAERYSAVALPGDVFVINSFSKYFGMTGWRIGWMVVPERYMRSVDVLAQNLFLSTSAPAQHAAVVALSAALEPELEERREAFRERRDFLVQALRDRGFGVGVQPEGAFYVYADCSAFTDDSYRFCQRLLEEAGVAATPGIDFGEHRANQFLRFAYTTPVDNIREGMRRLDDFLRGL